MGFGLVGGPLGGALPPGAENFPKLAKLFLKKISRMYYFSVFSQTLLKTLNFSLVFAMVFQKMEPSETISFFYNNLPIFDCGIRSVRISIPNLDSKILCFVYYPETYHTVNRIRNLL